MLAGRGGKKGVVLGEIEGYQSLIGSQGRFTVQCKHIWSAHYIR